MRRLNKDIVQKVKEANNLIEVASEYYDLIEVGDVYKARCKHGETNPSLTFYPHTESYYCYGCQAGSDGGDVISFIEWMEECTWKEAVEQLAERAGIDPYIQEDEFSIEYLLYEKKLQMNRDYWRNLQTDDHAKSWFYSKGLDDGDIDLWRLGSSNGKPVYSIADFSGRTVGFAYRTDTEQKYINSRTDEIFRKSSVLYGLHIAREQLKKKKYLVLVEGYNDAIVLNKYQIPAVALMGTMMSNRHLEILKNITSQVIIWLDGDEAGVKFGEEIAIRLENEGVQTFIINITGFDPDEIALRQKKETETFIQENKADSLTYIINKHINIYHQNMMDETKKMTSNTKKIIDKVKNINVKNRLLQMVEMATKY